MYRRYLYFVALTIAVLGSLPSLAFQAGTGAGRGAAASGPNAIVGRVVDGTGRGVPHVFVTALTPTATAPHGFAFVSALLKATTDELGEFRLTNLPFGPVYVIAIPHNAGAGSDGRLNRTGYGRTFFPSASNLKDAQTVMVTPSGPARADITLQSTSLWTMAGVVIGDDGQPVAGGTLPVAHGDGLFGLDSGTMALRPNGAFAIAGMAPGTYHLQFREGPWPPPRGTIPKISAAKVIVVDADIRDIRVVPIHLVSATGRLRIESAVRASLQGTPVVVGASPVDFDGNPGPQQPGVVRDDLTFEFKTWPGLGQIRVTPGQLLSIKAIRLNGVDITNSPIAFIEGKDVTGLEVELVKKPLPDRRR